MEENKIYTFTQKQRRVLSLMGQFYSIKSLCEHSNISRKTFYNWMKEEGFRKAYSQIENDLLLEAKQDLKLSVRFALSKLIRNAVDDEYYLKDTKLKSILAILDRVGLGVKQLNTIFESDEKMSEFFNSITGVMDYNEETGEYIIDGRVYTPVSP